MKLHFVFLLLFITMKSFGQNKYDYISFNKLTEIQGTEYVIASIDNWGKMSEHKSRYYLIINTKTGQTNQIDFLSNIYLDKFEQVKIDSLGINKIIIAARTVDLDGKRGIDWTDPVQILIMSTDGKEKSQLTDSKLFVRNWVINRLTGTIIITGHYDTNNNNKYDKTDKNEIGIYDLRTLKLVSRI